MTLSLGFWDRLFGKKTTLEQPDGKGGIVKYVVTEKWHAEMGKQGKLQVLSNLIRVHILDPLAKGGYQIKHWTIGEDISEDLVTQYKDQQTNELYAMIAYEGGEGKTMILKKALFDQAYTKIIAINKGEAN
ncbi:diphthamide synthase (EF-2-diphthine--ammonia ligase) [Paenibacillus mucilaginosus]|uniref:hypothetical protein n=1 Tax=Paenibacillus mucilaginosus TaxID=61624 RepID=UPI003D243D94